MKKLLPLAAAALALIGAAPGASAATQIGEYFSLSGFGTLGAVKTNSDEGKFGKDRQPGGADKQTSFDVDSNLGLQMTGTATSWLSGTVQVLAAKRDKKAHITPEVEWAFVTVKPLEGLTLRGGRIAAPVFAISDSRNIGYANTWVRAPNEVYALNVFDNINGGDATYRKTLGPVAVSLTGFAGESEFFVAAAGLKIDVKRVRGLNLQLETDWATFRLGQSTADVYIPGLPAPDGYKFTGLGATVDRDNIVAQAEYVTRRSSTLGPQVDANGWYVMGGYRFGTVTPYAVVSRTSPKVPSSPVLFSAAQNTKAVGVRWDAFKFADLKFQIDRVGTDGSPGISFTTPDFVPPTGGRPLPSGLTHSVTVFSLACDFAF